MSYTYYEGDGTLLRSSHPKLMLGLEIYRGGGEWEPYQATKELYLTRPEISEEDAKASMDFMDGKGVLCEWDDDAEDYMPVEPDDEQTTDESEVDE